LLLSLYAGMLSRYLLRFKSVDIETNRKPRNFQATCHILKCRVLYNRMLLEVSRCLSVTFVYRSLFLVPFVKKIRKRGHTDGQLRYRVGQEQLLAFKLPVSV